MRLILLLLALAVAALLTVQSLKSPPPAPSPPHVEGQGAAMPQVPTRPQDLPAFEQDLNRALQDAAAEQRRRIDAAE